MPFFARLRFVAFFAAFASACSDSPERAHDADGGDTPTDAAHSLDDGGTTPPPEGRIFDHRHMISPAAIPEACIDHLRSGDFVFHYAHRSHGSQITVGAELLEDEDPRYAFDAEYCEAPSSGGVLPMWDGMTAGTGATVVADQYWSEASGADELREILEDNPEIRYTSWAWSFDVIDQTRESVQLYLDTLSALELEFPGVTFVYMTGPADAGYDDASHRLRAELNAQIRTYAAAHGKVLFDFEDMDAWSDGEHASREINGQEIPMRHADYDFGSEAGYEGTHTTPLACTNKARAFWWMLATLEGCAGL